LDGLLIFSLRVVDTSLQTMRVMMMARGYKLFTALLGFAGSLVYIKAISPVIQNMHSWTNLLGYAAGFATGMVVGLIVEDRLAMGFALLRIISSRRGVELAETLRAAGYAVTEISAWGKDGNVSVLYCFISRKRVEELIELVHSTDEEAFVSAENVRSVRRGYY
jgi:uncharacterized protein YebE (UPF0316 family)